ncbi:hypothetical protein ACFY7C_18100 [Streptomyces sp. NPDC012769]|uniref:hypothetical protein n=1 Tax=Streptomyces sp. NPDC012769 TaxID=3364848 RepID=UPI0036A598AD
MSEAPIIVHPPSPSGGRRVTVQARGQEVGYLGLAHSDHELVVFLEGAGLLDPERILDDPHWVSWRGGRPHEYRAA